MTTQTKRFCLDAFDTQVVGDLTRSFATRHGPEGLKMMRLVPDAARTLVTF